MVAATLALALAQQPALVACVAQVREGTSRYRGRNAAIADGYRALGPDAPGMGQHWMHPGLVLAGRFDPRHPQVLAYITVQGQPVLAGVAFAIPTDAGDASPGLAPDSAWHLHGRTIDEESFIADHHHAPGTTASGTRVAVLHAWVWQENPDGVFAPDNWSLPFVRLGLPVPVAFSRDAARSLSLALPGGAAFMRRAFPDLSGMDDRKQGIERWLSNRAGALSTGDLQWLADEWRRQ